MIIVLGKKRATAMNQIPLTKSPAPGFTRWEWALVLIVIGARLAVFSYAGSPLPYFDQWLSEFNNTLVRISVGDGFAALFYRSNEHLIITTKMLTLLGYYINGYWDVPFLAICSAGVRALTAAWTFQLISCAARPKTKVLLWLLCAVIFAVPFSGYNFLSGMQVCFYLADCALLWSLRTVTNWTSPFTGGLALICCTLFGMASLASAITIPACTLAVHLFQRRARPGFWPSWTISAMIVLIFIGTTINTEAISVRHVQFPLPAMIHFWLQLVAWPTSLAPIGALLVLLGAISLLVAFKRPPCRTAAQAAILGLGVYAALNAAFIAVNRDPSEWHMRHWDTIAFLPLAALAFGLRLADLNIFKRPVLLILGALGFCYAVYAGNLIRTVSWPYLQAAHETRSAALDHYRTLLLQQDLQVEFERMNVLIEQQSMLFFDDPIGRFSLHPGVIQNLINLHRRPLTLLSPEIIPLRRPSSFSRFTDRLIACGWLLGLLGIMLGIAAMCRELRRTPDPT